jgi:hypothetical protein
MAAENRREARLPALATQARSQQTLGMHFPFIVVQSVSLEGDATSREEQLQRKYYSFLILTDFPANNEEGLIFGRLIAHVEVTWRPVRVGR